MRRVNNVFVAGLNSDLFYLINDIDCKIICRDKSVAFCYANKNGDLEIIIRSLSDI